MPTPWPHVLTPAAIVISVISHGAAAQDNGDEFSNNLASDLGPLLALFGEQFARQFMSQSMSWADNVLFACAPLGIIAAVVGAIRVGGPSWLKALIGRARETAATAELDLMSSTSHEVCELWNGEALVRVMGSAPVQEFLFFEDIGGNAGPATTDEDLLAEKLFRITTLEEVKAKKFPLLTRKRSRSEWLRKILWSPRPADDTEQGNTAQLQTVDPSGRLIREDASRDAPNISLNLSPKMKGQVELYCMALLGIFVQAAVLAAGGLVTYRYKLQKGGGDVRPYAYPVTATGTLVLVVGMFICASVVERSTKEIEWIQIPTGKRYHIRCLWLQRGRIVNDQTFESYAIIAKGARDEVLTSRRRTSRVRVQRVDSIATTNHKHSQQNGWRKLLGKTIPNPFEAATVVGTVVSITGFVLQFVGLRASHWSLSIAQLLATFLMTMVRAVERRSLVERPFNQPLQPGHELDWLATGIGRNRGMFWQHTTAEDLPSSSENSLDAYALEKTWAWGILTGDNARADGHWGPTPPCGMNNSSQDLVKLRMRMGKLSKWTGPTSELAVSVASSIDEAMNMLSFNEAGDTVFTWSVNVQFGDRNELIELTVKRSSVTTPWAANAAEIEAVLSLWIYHTRETERKMRDTLAETQKPDSEDSEDDWLRHGDAALQRQNLQLLGLYSPCLLRDLKWWTPRTSTLLRVNSTTPAASPTLPGQLGMHPRTPPPSPIVTGLTQISVPYTKITGFSDLSNRIGNGAIGPIALNYDVDKVAFDEIEASPAITGSLAVMTDNSLEISYGQHLFSSFMWAVSRKVSRIENPANARQLDMFNNPTAWNSIALDHARLERIVHTVQKSGLGTLEEGYLCIVPPLSMANKLPAAAAVDSIIQTMKAREADSTLPELSAVYMELLRFASTFRESAEGVLCPFSFKAVAAAIEYYRTVVLAAQLSTRQLRDAGALTSLRDDLRAQLEKVDKKTMSFLHVLYKNQDRMEGLEDLLPGLSDRDKPDDAEIAMYLGYTPLHQEVISRKLTKVQNLRLLGERDLLGFTPLHYAVNIPGSDDETVISSLLDSGADVNSQDTMGYTCLMYACLKGKRKQATLLLKRKADITLRGRDELTALHCAAIGGVQGIVRKILEQRAANVDVADRYQRTALHWSAFLGNFSVAELLLKWKASRDARDDFDRTPLHAACLCEDEWLRMECVKLLLKDSGDLKEAKDKDGKRAVALAVEKKHRDVMRLLAQNDHDAQVALRSSAENGELDSVKALTEKGVDIDSRDEENDRNALHFAAAAGHDKIVVHLLEKAGENLKSYVNSASADGWTALHHAANGSGDYADTVRELISHGADKLLKDGRGRTPLLLACLLPGHHRVIEHLIHDGIDAVTGLHRAIEFGDEPTVRVLVGLGVDLETFDTHYESVNPLRCAARFGRHEIVKLLLSKHVNLGEPRGEMVALHWACERGRVDIARTLLDAGTEIDIKDFRGNTALHQAAASGSAEVVRLLLERGADKNALNDAGETPLVVCREQGTEKQLPEGKKEVEALLDDAAEGSTGSSAPIVGSGVSGAGTMDITPQG